MTTEDAADEDVDSGWDSDGSAETASPAPPPASSTKPAGSAPRAADEKKPAAPEVKPPPKPSGKSGSSLLASAKELAVGMGANRPKPAVAVRPPPGTGAPKVTAPKPVPSVPPLAKPAASVAPAPRPAAPAPSITTARPSGPEIDLAKTTEAPAATPPPKSRSFTPKVTNAVQQAKALDTEATAKPVPRRPTPMRVPTVTPSSGAAPAPELPAKLPTTSLRFSEKEGEAAEPRVPPKRKETLKLNRAAQDLAIELSNDEADVYSQRMRAAESTPPPDQERISAPALDLDLGDFSLDDAKSKPPAAPTEERAPATARSSETPVPKPPEAKPPEARKEPMARPPRPGADKDPLAARLAPPRLPSAGLRASAGFRAPLGPRDADKSESRVNTPAVATSPALAGAAPTKPPPPALPTPVPPGGGGGEGAPELSVEVGAELEVSLSVDETDLGDLEIDLLAETREAPAADEFADLSLDIELPPRRTPVAPRLEGPPSAEPATVRGGPDDDPELAPIRDRFERRDYMGALMRAEALLAKNPDHAGAKYFATTCQDRVKEMYIARLGSSTSVPRVVMPPDAIQALALDHRSGFLISLIDGLATVDDVLDISGMPTLEALRLLFELKNEGVIDT